MKVSRGDIRRLAKLNKWGECVVNASLKNLTTFKIGGNAKVLLKIKTIESFIKVMDYISKKKLPYFIIGNGSNILASSKGYDGVLIKFAGDFDRIESYENILECGSAVMLGAVLSKSRKLCLSGCEDCVGIPASVGGATYMNAGAYNFEMAKVIESVVAFVDGKIAYFKNEDCAFGYRKSIFQENNAIILRVRFKLSNSTRKEIDERCKEIIGKRKNSQPLECLSAGSVFKRMDNLIVSKCLDDCNVKGLNIGDAEVSQKHANFIINKGNASSQDVVSLINKIKKIFTEKYNEKLETEIKLLGEFDETIG